VEILSNFLCNREVDENIYFDIKLLSCFSQKFGKHKGVALAYRSFVATLVGVRDIFGQGNW
jgi:hypothetical protein